MVNENLQQEGLLDEEMEMVYLIIENNNDQATVVGCYSDSKRAYFRLAVLQAEEALRLAKAREMHQDKGLDEYSFDRICYRLTCATLYR